MNSIQMDSDPIAVLMQEHHRAAKQLSLLEQAVISINVDGFTRHAFECIAEAIRFFEGEFRQHDKKEEQFLFPLLEKHQPGITREYRNEHRELWSAFNHLLSCVNDVEDGRLRGSSRQELVETATRIVHLLRAHIANENTILFVKAKKLFSTEEYKEFRDNVASVTA
ncbi:MAG: hemerythrin domain-containing protein [Ignavibacteriales bacterium]|nr:hemerythrin domain-containing protein [Ignavibacteriales bacterium]